LKKATKNQIITVFVLLIFLGSSLTFAIISAFPNETNAAGWRARIVIAIFGESYPIPGDVGIINNETKAKVFTISTDGIVSKGVSEDVTLKDFFDVWDKTFNSTCILDYCNTNTSSMVMYVNGKENTDYELYTIKNNDVIIIDYR
jgi:hypothetical protein